jgi:hypothetical protein
MRRIFDDAHHPSLASHLNLAQAVLDQLHKRRALGLGGEGAPAPIIDPAECAAHFQIDFQVWAGVCVKSGMYFKHSVAARYESTEREAKHLRFAQAARGADQAETSTPRAGGNSRGRSAAPGLLPLGLVDREPTPRARPDASGEAPLQNCAPSPDPMVCRIASGLKERAGNNFLISSWRFGPSAGP